MTAAQTLQIEIPEAKAGMRLDKALSDLAPDLSRSRIKALLTQGLIRLSGAGRKVDDPAKAVRAGEIYLIEVPPPEAAEPEGQAIPLTILYEDDHLIVIDKPAGLVVHPGAGNPDRTLVNALIAHCGDSLSGIGGVRRPGIVHRLDKDTSGVMVAAKSDKAHLGLARQFAEHGREAQSGSARRGLEREYLALVWGCPRPAKGTLTTRLGRSPRNRQKMAVLPETASAGRTAITEYEVLKRFGPRETRAVEPLASLVRCRLKTGRTHQIRVHMAHLGAPVIGDALYGRGQATRVRRLPAPAAGAIEGLTRQALHAALLGFDHPVSGEHLRFESPLPKQLADILDFLEEI